MRKLDLRRAGIMLTPFPMSGPTIPPDKLEQLRARVSSAATPAERVEASPPLAEEIWLSDPVAARPLVSCRFQIRL
jgi:hypothetical protein